MKTTYLLFALLLSATVFSQDLPENPEPGKCYVRCTTPDVYVNETVQVMIKPAYKVLKSIPATYKTVTERVLVKEASKRFTAVPAKYGKETVEFVSKVGANSLSIIPTTFKPSEEIIEVKPAYAVWELGAAAPDCASGNPDDCRFWCYKGYPAKFEVVQTQIINDDVSTRSKSIASKNGSYIKTVVVEPARVVEIEIPAVYKEITKTILVKDAHTTENSIAAIYKDVTKEVLKEKGGLTTWRVVECALVEYQALPIQWNLGSATLTSVAKRLIDTRLMPVLKQNPGVKLEIASHTDSRGKSVSNQDLSERRAKAVATYLMAKGVNSSLLVANGYGERKLKNRCADGVSCTERDHAINRRTEFRLIK